MLSLVTAALAGVSPWAYRPHVLAWVLLLMAAAAYLGAGRRGRREIGTRGGPGAGPPSAAPASATNRKERWCFLGAWLTAAAAFTWPVADLAAHWSLTALVFQRLVLTLAVAPLGILAMPTPWLVAWTRPAPVDAVLRWCSRPLTALFLVTVVGVATLTTPLVEAQASSAFARGAVDLALFAAGLVLWSPILQKLPGASRPSLPGRAGYLIIQSVLPSFPAVIFIFARRPLYPAFEHAGRVAGLTTVDDQQAAGFVAKLTTIAVLWIVAFVLLSRAQLAEAADDEEDEDVGGSRGSDGEEPLLWPDVERQLLRAERREKRAAREQENWERRRPAGPEVTDRDETRNKDDPLGPISNP